MKRHRVGNCDLLRQTHLPGARALQGATDAIAKPLQQGDMASRRVASLGPRVKAGIAENGSAGFRKYQAWRRWVNTPRYRASIGSWGDYFRLENKKQDEKGLWISLRRMSQWREVTIRPKPYDEFKEVTIIPVLPRFLGGYLLHALSDLHGKYDLVALAFRPAAAGGGGVHPLGEYFHKSNAKTVPPRKVVEGPVIGLTNRLTPEASSKYIRFDIPGPTEGIRGLFRHIHFRLGTPRFAVNDLKHLFGGWSGFRRRTAPEWKRACIVCPVEDIVNYEEGLTRLGFTSRPEINEVLGLDLEAMDAEYPQIRGHEVPRWKFRLAFWALHGSALVVFAIISAVIICPLVLEYFSPPKESYFLNPKGEGGEQREPGPASA